ncbi:tRNA (guanosine(46)-N7)-methyltransferase TrmB [Mycobacteroides abscessus subsp. abscessus]|uniref:tRNA (guanosine(46)-N7)-methyltransferase TrmB n=1 Tax=Mycobacteroides abscessus TaxID=36809 RepID=UPI0019D01879|nr:tRNA (guanosine(46)-N7)-methyltransferase TrmB [Mycobacteroides abscessus subsp. abscessus]
MGDHGDMRCDGQERGCAEAGSATDELPGTVGAASSGRTDSQNHHPRRVSSFRSRGSSLSEGQQKAWDRSWPTYGRLAREADGSCPPLDPATWFGRTAPLILEIGCGTGTSTAAMALQEPDFDVLAVEVYRKGLAQLLSAIDREGIENIRLIRGDALDVLEHLLPSGSLTAARVFFPDPWPKARHHKRRLLQPGTVALLSDRLRPGGTLHVATDHANYTEHIAEVGDGEPTLRRLRLDDPRIPVSVNRPTTKFEGKAHTVGSVINDFVWERL